MRKGGEGETKGIKDSREWKRRRSVWKRKGEQTWDIFRTEKTNTQRSVEKTLKARKTDGIFKKKRRKKCRGERTAGWGSNPVHVLP